MKRGFIILSIVITLISLFFLSLVIAPSASSFLWSNQEIYRQSDQIVVAADVRLFTTMCIFNSIYNFDEELGSSMNPVREKVRAKLTERLNQVPTQQIAKWKKFYDKKNYHLYHYVFYTMSLSEQYPFKKALAQPGNWFSRFQYLLWGLNGFEKIMNEFWIAMDLDSLWQEILPDYIAEIEKWDVKRIANEETMIWDYIRKLNPNYTRYLVSIPNLLDSHYSAFALDYGNYYFTVSSPGSHDYGLNIHEYLHGAIGSIMDKHIKKYQKKLEPYFAGAQQMQVIKNNYNSLSNFIEENMVRAIDLRIRILNYEDSLNIRSQLTAQEADGFNLILIFYHLLQEYEQDYQTFEEYIDRIFEMVPYYEDYMKQKR